MENPTISTSDSSSPKPSYKNLKIPECVKNRSRSHSNNSPKGSPKRTSHRSPRKPQRFIWLLGADRIPIKKVVLKEIDEKICPEIFSNVFNTYNIEVFIAVGYDELDELDDILGREVIVDLCTKKGIKLELHYEKEISEFCKIMEQSRDKIIAIYGTNQTKKIIEVLICYSFGIELERIINHDNNIVINNTEYSCTDLLSNRPGIPDNATYCLMGYILDLLTERILHSDNAETKFSSMEQDKIKEYCLTQLIATKLSRLQLASTKF